VAHDGYHLLGRRDEAVKTQEKVLELVPENDVWDRGTQELRLMVYKSTGFSDAAPAEVLPGTWTGAAGPIPVTLEFWREGGYVFGYIQYALPWIPAGEAMWRYNVTSGVYEIQLADDGWTNPRWYPADGRVTDQGRVVLWRLGDWRGLVLDPAPAPRAGASPPIVLTGSFPYHAVGEWKRKNP
jgi:hypothetical protein